MNDDVNRSSVRWQITEAELREYRDSLIDPGRTNEERERHEELQLTLGRRIVAAKNGEDMALVLDRCGFVTTYVKAATAGLQSALHPALQWEHVVEAIEAAGGEVLSSL